MNMTRILDRITDANVIWMINPWHCGGSDGTSSKLMRAVSAC